VDAENNMDKHIMWWHNCEVDVKFKLNSITKAEELRDFLKKFGEQSEAEEVAKLIEDQISGKCCKDIKRQAE